jgi:hypothetical protein
LFQSTHLSGATGEKNSHDITIIGKRKRKTNERILRPAIRRDKTATADNAFLKIKVGNKEEVVKGIKQQYDLKTPTKNRQPA